MLLLRAADLNARRLKYPLLGPGSPQQKPSAHTSIHTSGKVKRQQKPSAHTSIHHENSRFACKSAPVGRMYGKRVKNQSY